MRRGDLRRWKVVVGGCFNQNLHPFLALCELGETSRLLTLRPVDRPAPPPTHAKGERTENDSREVGIWSSRTKESGMQRVNPLSWGGGGGDKRTQPETKVGGGGKSEGVSCLHDTIWGFCFRSVGGVSEDKSEGHGRAGEHVRRLLMRRCSVRYHELGEI